MVAQRDIGRDFRLSTSLFRMLPDFMIAGEAKCGTTSLYRYILEHPDVLPCDRKEPKNFIEHRKSLLYCRSHYPLLIQKYLAGALRGRLPITGEATAEYLSDPNVPCDIATVLPEVKVIIMLRNPVERAYSDYCMFSNRDRAQYSFEDIVSRSIEWLCDPSLNDLVEAALHLEHFYLRFVARGIYVRNVERWMNWFPAEQILIVKSEEFFRNTQEVTNQVFEFLGLEPFTIPRSDIKRKGEYLTNMSEETRRKLDEFYAPYNEKLYQLVGTNMGWGEEAVDPETRGQAGRYKVCSS